MADIVPPAASGIVATPLEDPEVAGPAPASAGLERPRLGVTFLSRPFLTVGLFRVQENAMDAAQTLSDAGIIPLVEEQQINGRMFYRVVVGPARNGRERATLLKQVQDQGFSDAYFVKN